MSFRFEVYFEGVGMMRCVKTKAKRFVLTPWKIFGNNKKENTFGIPVLLSSSCTCSRSLPLYVILRLFLRSMTGTPRLCTKRHTRRTGTEQVTRVFYNIYRKSKTRARDEHNTSKMIINAITFQCCCFYSE